MGDTSLEGAQFKRLEDEFDFYLDGPSTNNPLAE